MLPLLSRNACTRLFVLWHWSMRTLLHIITRQLWQSSILCLQLHFEFV